MLEDELLARLERKVDRLTGLVAVVIVLLAGLLYPPLLGVVVVSAVLLLLLLVSAPVRSHFPTLALKCGRFVGRMFGLRDSDSSGSD